MSFLVDAIRYLLNPRANTARLSTTPAAAEQDVDGLPQGRLDGGLRLRHFLYNPALLLGSVLLIAMVVTVLFGPLWVAFDPYISTQTMLPHYDAETGEFIRLPFPPSAEFPLGTDEWGNDMVSLIVYGARVTLIAGVYITLARLALGAVLGSVAGWRPGAWMDRAIMNVVGVLASIPVLLSSMILIYALDIRRGVIVFVVALALTGWTETAEYVRAEILALRNLPYVEGARALGLNELQIVVRHILPNLLPQLLILSFLEMGAVLILMAELGFLDVFIGGGSLFTLDPTAGRTVRLADVPEWGALVANGAPSLRSNAHLVMGPALAFFAAIVGVNAFGEGMRRLLQRSTFNTAFLLQRRTLLGLVIFLIVSRVALQYTGHDYSFDRVASRFSAANAATHVSEMTALGDERQTVRGVDFEIDAAAAYIQEQFVAQEVFRGWKPPGNINQSYFYTVPGANGPEVKAVLGFMPGYDTRVSAELIVLLAPFGEDMGSLREPTGVGVMLETARLWREHDVDPRRSLLLVAWKGTLDEAQTFLSDPELFTFLPAPTRIIPHPRLLIRLDDMGSGEDVLLLHGGSDEDLVRLFSAAAGNSDVETETATYSAPPPHMAGNPAIALRWANAARAQALHRDQLQAAGEVLNRALLRITRLADYTS